MTTHAAHKQPPTVGRIVHYRLSANDVAHINSVRDFEGRGNQPTVGDVVPLIIVRVWPDEYANSKPGQYVDGKFVELELHSTFGVNGQAILDGNDTQWVCSASEGPGPGQWSWPPRA